MQLRTLREAFRPLSGNVASNSTGCVELRPARATPRVAVLRIDNARSANALTGTIMARLADAVDALEQLVAVGSGSNDHSHQHHQSEINNHSALGLNGNELAGLVLATSEASPVFCGGLDLSVARDHINTPEQGRRMCQLMTDTLTRLRALPLVSVAAVHGPAIGGGSELTTTCDFRFMDSAAYIQFKHVVLGTVPGWGGAERLHRIVGRREALRIMCSAGRIDAAEALRIGLVDHVYERKQKNVEGKRRKEGEGKENDTTAGNESNDGDEDLAELAAAWLAKNIIHSTAPAVAIRAAKETIVIADERDRYQRYRVTASSTLDTDAAVSSYPSSEEDIFARMWGSQTNARAIAATMSGHAKK